MLLKMQQSEKWYKYRMTIMVRSYVFLCHMDSYYTCFFKNVTHNAFLILPDTHDTQDAIETNHTYGQRVSLLIWGSPRRICIGNIASTAVVFCPALIASLY